jgi:hypothetical protein
MLTRPRNIKKFIFGTGSRVEGMNVKRDNMKMTIDQKMEITN